MKGSKWFVERQLWNDRIAVHCTHEDERGRYYVEYREAMHDITSHAVAPACAPSLSLTENDAQQLMNELWLAGLRPKNGAGAIAHTESLQSHLDDLRTIAFHALKIESR